MLIGIIQGREKGEPQLTLDAAIKLGPASPHRPAPPAPQRRSSAPLTSPVLSRDHSLSLPPVGSGMCVPFCLKPLSLLFRKPSFQSQLKGHPPEKPSLDHSLCSQPILR